MHRQTCRKRRFASTWTSLPPWDFGVGAGTLRMSRTSTCLLHTLNKWCTCHILVLTRIHHILRITSSIRKCLDPSHISKCLKTSRISNSLAPSRISKCLDHRCLQCKSQPPHQHLPRQCSQRPTGGTKSNQISEGTPRKSKPQCLSSQLPSHQNPCSPPQSMTKR